MKRSAETLMSSSAKKQKFKPEYSKLFPCLVASKVSDMHVRCLVCEIDFKCSSGGKNDCSRHVETLSHKDKSKPKNATALTSFFSATAKSTKTEQQPTHSTLMSELLMCQFVVEHNIPFSAMDSLAECIRQGFDDSHTAQAFKCGRTKATALIKEMSAIAINRLAKLMRERPFSIATDGSNDSGSGKKHYPLVVRVGTDEGVETGLLALGICEGQSTGKNIFDVVDREMDLHSIPWKNCLALGTDNAPNMVGKTSGVIAFTREAHDGIFKSGCVLHLVHIAARKGASHLAPIEEALVDIFYYFKKSSIRQSALKSFQDLYNMEHRKCLKHVCTRWLSIQRCVERLLYNWEPLKSYFSAEKDKQSSQLGKAKASCLLDFIRSPTNKLFCTFLVYFIKLFDPILVRLQAAEPLIHQLLPSMELLLREILTKFVKPEVIVGCDLLKVNFTDRSNKRLMRIWALGWMPSTSLRKQRQTTCALSA